MHRVTHLSKLKCLLYIVGEPRLYELRFLQTARGIVIDYMFVFVAAVSVTLKSDEPGIATYKYVKVQSESLGRLSSVDVQTEIQQEASYGIKGRFILQPSIITSTRHIHKLSQISSH